MGKNISRVRRTALAFTAVAALLVGTSVPANAAPSANVGLKVRASSCSQSYSWAGKNVGTAYPGAFWNRGTASFCVWKYRLDDEDKNYDYYMVFADATYKHTDGYQSLDASGYIDITSNKTGSITSATGSYSSSKSCTSALSIGVSLGIFSATITPQLCKGNSVTRTGVGGTYAAYSTPNVGEAPSMEGAYLQRVPNGTVPVYTVTFKRPTYSHKYDSGAQLYRETAAWTNWTAIL